MVSTPGGSINSTFARQLIETGYLGGGGGGAGVHTWDLSKRDALHLVCVYLSTLEELPTPGTVRCVCELRGGGG